MKTVIFGDVHGNLPALELMLRHAGRADRWICLGDVVNYGPWSNECADLIQTLPNCERLMGNHEEAFLAGWYSGAHPVARAFFDFCQPRFDRHAIVAAYKAGTEVGPFKVQHTIDGHYIFPDSALALDADYVVGHSHHQFVRRDRGFELYNAGSVGQNRKYLNVINYLVHGPGSRDMEMVGFTYDPDQVILEMKRQGYPPECVAYYTGKSRA